MGFEIPGEKLGTQLASANLTPNRFVVLSTTGTIAQVGTAGLQALGVNQSTVAAGDAAEVMISGVSKVIAGAAIANTGPISSDNQGRVITAATGHAINGLALETAAAAGEVIAVLLGYRGVAP